MNTTTCPRVIHVCPSLEPSQDDVSWFRTMFPEMRVAIFWYKQRHWINSSFVYARAAQVLGSSVFLIATQLSPELIQSYNSHTPLSKFRGEMVSVFCTVELSALRGVPIHVISRADTLEHCKAHSPDECKEWIARHAGLSGQLRVEDVCAGVSIANTAEVSASHPEHVCYPRRTGHT